MLAAAAYVLRLGPSFLWAFLPLGLLLITNLWLDGAARASVRSPQATLGAIFVFDILCLTSVLALTGGPMNPFSLLYLVQITLAAVVLRKEWTWILAGLSAVCFGLLFFLHVSLARASLTRAHIFLARQEFSRHLIGMWIAFIIAAALIGFFASRVSDALRLREQEVLALQDRIARQEKLASLVTLAAGAAHELGTPLGTIAVVARELERYAGSLASGDDLRDDARLIRSEVERCQHILQRMSAEGAEPVGESPRTIEAGELLRQTLQQVAEKRRSHVSLNAADAGTTLLLPVRATVQSLAALVENALEAGSGDVRVVVRARRRGAEMVFSVRDNGRGMSEEILRRVTEPFFTTREPGRGMGLGTFLVRTFAERLGGSLAYESAPGRGTTATLTLPLEFSGQTEKRGESSHVTA